MTAEIATACTDDIFGESAIPMFVCEADSWSIVAANDAATARTGWTRDDLCARTMLELLPARAHTALRRWVMEAPTGRGLFSSGSLWPQRCRDGSVIAVEIVCMPMAYHGRPAILTLAFEPSDGERAAAPLAELGVALKELHDLSRLGAVTGDGRTGRCQLSGTLAHAFGRTHLTISAFFQDLAGVVHPDDAGYAGELIRATERLEEFDGEFRVLIGGAPRWVHFFTSIIRSGTGAADGFIGIAYDVTDRRAEAARLHEMAFMDSETGLRNWTGVLQAAAAEPAVSALVLVDTTWIANTSDRHPQKRRNLANALAHALRQIAARDGEVIRYRERVFGILLRRDSRTRPPLGLARRIVSLCERPLTWDNEDFVVVPAIGLCGSIKGASLPDMATYAEAAMLEAQTLPTRIASYSPELQQAHDRRATVRRELRSAIVDERISVVYQPIVSMSTGKIVAAEALMRWDCPGIGPVPPSEFIEAAEETGAILRLGDWILRAACAQTRRWQLGGFASLRVAVNVSAFQVQQRDFVRTIRSVCEATGLSPSLLDLEITENAILHRDGCALRNLEALRRLGVGISVDDFGTGYSSLSYLATLPLGSLKLDRKFVEMVDREPFQAEVVKSVIALAHLRNLTVVGEGVETESQAQCLRDLGCDEAQGYLFGYPVSADEFGRLVAVQRFQHEPLRT